MNEFETKMMSATLATHDPDLKAEELVPVTQFIRLTMANELSRLVI